MIDIKSNGKTSNGIGLMNKKAWLIVDSDGKLKYCNNTFVKIFHIKKDDNIKELKFEPDLHNVILQLSESKLTEFNNPYIYVTDNQIYNFNVEIEKVSLFNTSYFIVVFNTETEERLLEDKISNLHYALEYGKIPVLIFDNNGIVSFATNSFEQIFNFNLDEIYHNHISTFLNKYLSVSELDNLISSIKTGQEWDSTISLISQHGEKLHFELKLNPILNDEGNILNFVLTAHNITHHILKNELVQKSEKQLKSIINNISDLLVILKKLHGKVLFEDGNDNFLKVFQIVKSISYQKPYEEILPISLVSKIKRVVETVESGTDEVLEFEYEDNDSFYIGKITIVDEPNDDGLLYIIALKDVSDEKRKKEQLNELYKKEMQLNRLKTTFLQNMSHEIRTPFTAIMGYSDIMVESIEEEDYETVVEITDSLKHVLHRVMNLFENILEVSEIETGDVYLEEVSINCNQILQAVYNKKIDDVKEKNLTMELDLDETSYLCSVDWGKFEKLILNLVENSIKYTDSGGIKIISKVVGSNILITIADTGLGINEKIISQLLEPFVQEELDGHSRNYEGAGLGLTIACEYTKLMNGEINIKSEKNVGTEVILSFPIISR